MAWLIISFILFCAYILFRSLNRMFGFIKPREKKFQIVKREPETFIAEEIKPDPVPTVTNIQNNYNTTQILIIEAQGKPE